MEESEQLIVECALGAALNIRGYIALAGIKIPEKVKDEILKECRKSIELYIVERGSVIQQLRPMDN